MKYKASNVKKLWFIAKLLNNPFRIDPQIPPSNINFKSALKLRVSFFDTIIIPKTQLTPLIRGCSGCKGTPEP